MQWIAIVPTGPPTGISRSADGQTWTATVVHGFGFTPTDLAYSAYGTTWIAVGITPLSIATSTDGASWATTTPITTTLTPTSAKIACDGYGTWLIVFADTVPAGTENVEMWASVDNGATWFQVWTLPDQVGGNLPFDNHLTLWYGGGRFFLLTENGVVTNAAFCSLRADL
jgi:hypothetical protein